MNNADDRAILGFVAGGIAVLLLLLRLLLAYCRW